MAFLTFLKLISCNGFPFSKYSSIQVGSSEKKQNGLEIFFKKKKNRLLEILNGKDIMSGFRNSNSIVTTSFHILLLFMFCDRVAQTINDSFILLLDSIVIGV